MASASAQLLAAIRRYGPSVDAIAQGYTNPVTGRHLSGTALLAKTLQGESSALTDPAGAQDKDSGKAHDAAQATPGSRAISIQKYGVDPNASLEDAVHFMSLHLRGKINGSKGLEGYNPGDPNYPTYILGQKVGDLGGPPGSSVTRSGSPGSTTTTTSTSSAGLDSSAAGTGLVDLLGQITQASKPQIQSAGLQGPSFSAAPTLPTGYQEPAAGGGGGGGASGGDKLAQMLQAVSGITGQDPTPGTRTDVTTSQGGSEASPASSSSEPRTPGGPIRDVKRLLSRAAAIDSQQLPYVYGGGHTAKTSKPGTPLDCSAAVSKVLGIDPRVSGAFENFGKAGPAGKGGVTIYANKGHVLMEIDGHFWGTSASNPRGGAGWIPRSAISSSYLEGFTARHL